MGELIESFAHRGGGGIIHVAEVGFGPLDHLFFEGLEIMDGGGLAVLVVAAFDEQVAVDLNEKGLAAGVLVYGLSDGGGDGIGREIGGGIGEKINSCGAVQIGETDLAGADEMVVPDAVEFTERRGAGDEKADAAAVLDGGAEEAHELEELGAAAGKEIFEAFRFVDAEEDAVAAGELIELGEPRFGGFHRRTGGKWRDVGAAGSFGLDDGLFGQFLPKGGDGGDRMGLEIEEDAESVRQHLREHFEE